MNHENTWELYARARRRRATSPPIISGRQDTADAAVADDARLDRRASRPRSTASTAKRVSGAQFDGTQLDEALEQAEKRAHHRGLLERSGARRHDVRPDHGRRRRALGEATVNADGSWLADIPPYVPVHLQPIDQFDLSIRNQTTWIQGMPGESRVCGGCHESRTAADRSDGSAAHHRRRQGSGADESRGRRAHRVPLGVRDDAGQPERDPDAAQREVRRVPQRDDERRRAAGVRTPSA